MTFTLRFISSLFLLSTLCSAQNPSSQHILEYASEARLFSEGLAAVQLGAQWELQNNIHDINSSNSIGKWGYIDKSGHIAITLQFDDANDFSNGLAPVKSKSKWGLINKNGKFIVEPIYDSLLAFLDGFITILTSPDHHMKMGYLDKSGKTILEAKYQGLKILDKDTFAVRENNLWGVMNNQGKWIVQPLLSSIENFQNNIAVMGIKKFDSIKYGAIDKNGTILIQPSYDRLFLYKEGVFLYRNGKDEGVLNEKGESIVEPKYQLIRSFKNGFAAIYANKKWGFIDSKGHIIVEPKYDYVADFNDNRALVGRKTGLFNIMHYGFINPQGEEIIQTKYNSATDFSEGLASVCRADFGSPSCGYIDENETMLIKDNFTYAESFKNGLARVTTSTYFPLKYFPKYINKKGDVVLETDEAIQGASWRTNTIMAHFALDSKLLVNKQSSDGVSSFRKDGKIGLIDKSGKIIAEPLYKSISSFKDGLAKAITQEGKVLYIDSQGAIVLQ